MSENVKSVNHGLPISVTKWWLVQGVTLPLPYDSCDRLQQIPSTTQAREIGQRRWMEGWLSLQRLKQLIEICTGPFFISILIQRQTFFWKHTDWVAQNRDMMESYNQHGTIWHHFCFTRLNLKSPFKTKAPLLNTDAFCDASHSHSGVSVSVQEV